MQEKERILKNQLFQDQQQHYHTLPYQVLPLTLKLSDQFQYISPIIIYSPSAITSTLNDHVLIILSHIIPFYIQLSNRFEQFHQPVITTLSPPMHEVDWFFEDEDNKWKIFDWRRCNLLENMLHHSSCQEFQLVYRDQLYNVSFNNMVMINSSSLHKIRRETAISTRPIKPGQGKWSYYNGLTWVNYDRGIQQQLEDKINLKKEVDKKKITNKQTYFSIFHEGKEFVFDLDQNVEVGEKDPLRGINKRKIVSRQWMTIHQLQELSRTKKQQEQIYVEERKRLEERVRQQMTQKKMYQMQLKQQQRQYWNQQKKQNNRNDQKNDLKFNQILQQLELKQEPQLSNEQLLQLQELHNISMDNDQEQNI